MSIESLQGTLNLMRGYPREAADTFLQIPDRVATETVWEYQLGFCFLEAGQPELSAEHFQKALELDPELTIAPLLRYYLDQMGVPAPETTTEDATTVKATIDDESGLVVPTTGEPGAGPDPFAPADATSEPARMPVGTDAFVEPSSSRTGSGDGS